MDDHWPLGHQDHQADPQSGGKVDHPEAGGVEVHQTQAPEGQRNKWAWVMDGAHAGVATSEEGICQVEVAGAAVVVVAAAVESLLLGEIYVCENGLLELGRLAVRVSEMWKVGAAVDRRGDALQELSVGFVAVAVEVVVAAAVAAAAEPQTADLAVGPEEGNRVALAMIASVLYLS